MNNSSMYLFYTKVGVISYKTLFPPPHIQVGVSWGTCCPHSFALYLKVVGFFIMVDLELVIPLVSLENETSLKFNALTKI